MTSIFINCQHIIKNFCLKKNIYIINMILILIINYYSEPGTATFVAVVPRFRQDLLDCRLDFSVTQNAIVKINKQNKIKNLMLQNKINKMP